MPEKLPRKMVVAHLIPGIPYGGGAESLLLDICRLISKEKFEVVVFYWAAGDDLAQGMRAAGARVVRLPLRKVLSWDSFKILVRALKEHRVDVLQTHFIDSDFLGAWAACAARIPMMVHVHSFPFPQRKRHAWRYWFMSPLFRRIIAVSGHVRACVSARTRIGLEKFVVVPNGVEFDRFADVFSDREKEALRREWGVGKGEKVVGTVTRFEADKDVSTLIKALPILLRQHPAVKVLIVGYGFEELKLKALSQSLGVSGRVVFAGRQTRVPLYLSIMDVFVLPAFEEAFGLSLLEAMAAGRPVVAADAAALPDLVTSGKDGFLFKARDPLSLAVAVGQALDDPGRANEMSLAARARAQGFTSRMMVGRLEELYAEVARHD